MTQTLGILNIFIILLVPFNCVTVDRESGSQVLVQCPLFLVCFFLCFLGGFCGLCFVWGFFVGFFFLVVCFVFVVVILGVFYIYFK